MDSLLLVPYPAFNRLWAYFGTYARAQILQILKDGITVGQLEIKDSVETHIFCASKNQGHNASLQVVNNDFWIRVFLTHDLGFAESYMFGDFTTPCLKSIFKVWLDNRQRLTSLSSLVNRIRYWLSGLLSRMHGQSLSNSIPNVVLGYDCSNTLFEAFLSKEMMYSCALWSESEGGLRGDIEHGTSPGQLEAAQRRKVQHILQKARIKKGDRVLEFGTGWGAMAIAAAEAGCTVDTLTLSVEQKKFAEERIKAAGFEDRIVVHFMDYRCLPAHFKNSFDAFVSCEMFEAVGLRYQAEFFKILDWALKPDRAVAVVTATAQPEFRYSKYHTYMDIKRRRGADYARQYQWPNTFLPSATSFVEVALQATNGRLVVESIEDHGPHYARTLREWEHRFKDSWKSGLADALIKEEPLLKEGDNINIFKRKWEYMYGYAEVGYARAYTSLNCWTLARPEYVAYPCD